MIGHPFNGTGGFVDDDWSRLIGFLAIACIFGAILSFYARVGMKEAEADWRRPMRRRYYVRCDYALRGNTSGTCPECEKRLTD